MLVNSLLAILIVALAAYAVLGGADFGAGFWDLTAGGQPRLADRRARGAVDVLPARLRAADGDAVRAALPRRRGDHLPRRRLCAARRGCLDLGGTAARRGLRALLGADAVLSRLRRRGGRLRAGTGPGRRKRSLLELARRDRALDRGACSRDRRLSGGRLPRGGLGAREDAGPDDRVPPPRARIRARRRRDGDRRPRPRP
jgi:hypothetical protein